MSARELAVGVAVLAAIVATLGPGTCAVAWLALTLGVHLGRLDERDERREREAALGRASA